MMERVIYSKFFSKRLASVSPEMCALLERDFSRTISLTHNGIDPLEIGINISQKMQPYLLFVGGDWERKGLMDVIECIKKIKHSYPTIKLYVAGSGSREVYVAMAQRLKVDENITWMGRVPRNQIPYSSKSILVSASYFEVSPLIFLEAAMAGAPIVSYPVFGTLEAANDGYLRTCEPSPNGLALEVARLLSDEQEMLKLSNAGILLRETKSWHLMVKETFDLYPL
jgi:glycosyltransferase involved in cell wall biosynthesis